VTHLSKNVWLQYISRLISLGLEISKEN